MTQDKESFISSEQRPEVSLKPDTPISELRARDLQTLLQGVTFSKIRGNDLKMFPEFKNSYGKPEKWETKDERLEWKYEKEKFENDKTSFGDKPNRENEGGVQVNPAPIDQLIRTISGLSEQVMQLTQEVQKLKQQSDKS